MVEPVASTDGGPGLGAPSEASPPSDPALPPDGASPAVEPKVPRPRSRRAPAVALVGVMVAIAGVAIWQAGRSASPAIVIPSLGPARSDPLVALLNRNGALVTVGASGQQVVLGGEPGATFGFPAWSPDGSRVAAVAYGATGTRLSI